MSNKKESGGSLVRHLLQVDAALVAASDEIGEALEDGATELPESVVERIHDFATAKAGNVDQLVEWLIFMKAQAAFLKEREALLTSQRQRFDQALVDVKKTLADRLHADNHPKLQGEALKIWVQNNPQPSVEISHEHLTDDGFDWVRPDEAQPGDGAGIPPNLREVRFEIKAGGDVAADIQTMLESIVEPMGAEIKVGPSEISTTKIRKAIEGGEEVRGARLRRGVHLRHSSPRPPKPPKVDAAGMEQLEG